MKDYVAQEFKEHLAVVSRAAESLSTDIERACQLVVETLSQGRKILIFGNGGSAADAQHIAAEFTGRYELERRGLPAIALTTDTSALTAIANDYGFDQIFARQLEALCAAGDLVLAISTSGNSPNVLAGLTRAKELDCKRVGLLGRDGGAAEALCDIAITVPSQDTARIQEVHITIGHILCGAVDRWSQRRSSS